MAGSGCCTLRNFLALSFLTSFYLIYQGNHVLVHSQNSDIYPNQLIRIYQTRSIQSCNSTMQPRAAFTATLSFKQPSAAFPSITRPTGGWMRNWEYLFTGAFTQFPVLRRPNSCSGTLPIPVCTYLLFLNSRNKLPAPVLHFADQALCKSLIDKV